MNRPKFMSSATVLVVVIVILTVFSGRHSIHDILTDDHNSIQRRLSCAWSNWQQKEICSPEKTKKTVMKSVVSHDIKPPIKPKPVVSTSPQSQIKKQEHDSATIHVEVDHHIKNKSSLSSSSSSSSSSSQQQQSVSSNHNKKLPERSSPYVSPLIATQHNHSISSRNHDTTPNSLQILRRTVLLMGPLHEGERKLRAQLLKHYAPYFAVVVFVFIGQNPTNHIEGALCNVDFIECNEWPKREKCWVDLLRDISNGHLPNAPNLRKLMHENINGTNTSRAHFTHFDGFLYSHADLWLNPFTLISTEWAPKAEHSLWFPNRRCSGAFAQSTMSPQAKHAVKESLTAISKSRLGPRFSFATKDPLFGCRGWSDIVYIPAVAVAEFEFLLKIFVGVGTFHESAIATVECLLSPIYGMRSLYCFGEPGFGNEVKLALPGEHVKGDHNGGGKHNDMISFPCGHRWALEDPQLAKTLVEEVLRVPLKERFPDCPV